MLERQKPYSLSAVAPLQLLQLPPDELELELPHEEGSKENPYSSEKDEEHI